MECLDNIQHRSPHLDQQSFVFVLCRCIKQLQAPLQKIACQFIAHSIPNPKVRPMQPTSTLGSISTITARAAHCLRSDAAASLS